MSADMARRSLWGLGECCGMSAGKNLGFTNLEIVEQNASGESECVCECACVCAGTCMLAEHGWHEADPQGPLQAPGHWDLS